MGTSSFFKTSYNWLNALTAHIVTANYKPFKKLFSIFDWLSPSAARLAFARSFCRCSPWTSS